MRISVILGFLLFGLMLPVTGWAAFDCSEDAWEKPLNARTIQECHATVEALANQCDEMARDSTMGQQFSGYALNSCMTKVMNSSLDQRLLKLKGQDSKQFAKEMQLQKAFNKAVAKVCYAYNSCDGTMYKVAVVECQNNLVEWRQRQAEQINAGMLAPEPVQEPTDVKEPAIAAFVKGLCAMPKDVFKDGVVPQDCIQKFTADFIKQTGGDCR